MRSRATPSPCGRAVADSVGHGRHRHVLVHDERDAGVAQDLLGRSRLVLIGHDVDRDSLETSLRAFDHAARG